MDLQKRLEKIEEISKKKLELNQIGKSEMDAFVKDTVQNYLNFKSKVINLSYENPSEALKLINYLEGMFGVSTNLVKSLEDGWLIPNVHLYDGRIVDKILKNKLLEVKTQENHIKYAKKVGESDFHIEDLPVLNAMFGALVDHKDQDAAKEAIVFVKDSMLNRYLVTGTSVNHKAKGEDEVYHKLMEIKKQVMAVGPNEYIKDTNDGSFYWELFLENDLGKLNCIYQEIIGRDLYSWRLNSKLKKDEEKVVRSIADLEWSHVDLIGNSSDEWRCFGVKASQTKSTVR